MTRGSRTRDSWEEGGANWVALIGGAAESSFFEQTTMAAPRQGTEGAGRRGGQVTAALQADDGEGGELALDGQQVWVREGR